MLEARFRKISTCIIIIIIKKEKEEEKTQTFLKAGESQSNCQLRCPSGKL